MAKEKYYLSNGEVIPIERYIGFFKFRFLEFQNEFVKEIQDKHNIDLNLTKVNNYLVDEVARKPIISLFTNGFCLHFAKMLEMAYPGGWVCFEPGPDCSHIVYVYENHIYDIRGDRTEDVKKLGAQGIKKSYIYVDLMPDELKIYVHNRERGKRTRKEIANKLNTLGKISNHKLIWSVDDIIERIDSKHRNEINQQIKEYFEDKK